MKVLVELKVGVGAWARTKVIQLYQCPHKGDSVQVETGGVFHAEHVVIQADRVYVSDPIRFSSQEAMAVALPLREGWHDQS